MRAYGGWAACLLVLPLMACQADGQQPDDPATPSIPQRTGPPAGRDQSLRDAALELVEAREQALLDGDRDAFLATIDPGAADFARTQARWWDNLAELPTTDVSLELGDEDMMTRIAGAGDLQLPVDFTMRLAGFDEHPVTQPLVYTFVGDEDEVLLSNDRNVQSDAFTGWLPAPWDVTDIVVEQTDDVLGVFDQETQDTAQAIVAATEDALAVLEDARVPDWSGRVTVYAISDLEALDRMSLMEVDQTGGVAFPVAVRPGRRKLAAYRMVLNPASTRTDVQRTLILRHELTHVALGDGDDRSPEWLVEGSAEYVAVSTYPLRERQAGWNATLAGAEDPQLRRGRDFYQVDPTVSYTVAGAVCDYLATTRGPDVLWDLMAAFDRARASNAADDDAVLQRELGVDAEQLIADALTWVTG